MSQRRTARTERNLKAPGPVPGASRHWATERPVLLPKAPTFSLVFISVQQGRTIGQRTPAPPISKLGWERVRQAWAGQVKARPPGFSSASCQLGFRDPGLGKALRRPGPKLSSRWPSALGARSPPPVPACPLRSLALNSTPEAFLKRKLIRSVRRSRSLTNNKARAAGSPRRVSSGLGGEALPSPAQPGGSPGDGGAGSPVKAPASQGAPRGATKWVRRGRTATPRPLLLRARRSASWL